MYGPILGNNLANGLGTLPLDGGCQGTHEVLSDGDVNMMDSLYPVQSRGIRATLL